MKTTHRPYSDESGDFGRVCRLIRANAADARAYSTWCLGRFVDWKYALWGAKQTTPGFWQRNAELWLDAFGDLAGLAISESGDAEFAIVAGAGYRFLYEEMLDWALRSWGDRGPRLATEIAERQEIEARALERRGFRLGATFYTRRFDLTREPAARAPLEPGFTIVDMGARPDYRQQRLLRIDGFQGKVLPEEEVQRQMEIEAYARQGPIYHASTDLCVVAPDGRFVAGCEALIDARNAEADVERVCTHSEFRRRGFARAAIQECLERLRAMGLRSAYITGYSPGAIALYGSLGHAEERENWIYETAPA